VSSTCYVGSPVSTSFVIWTLVSGQIGQEVGAQGLKKLKLISRLDVTPLTHQPPQMHIRLMWVQSCHMGVTR